MISEPFVTEATISKAETLVDGGTKLTVYTQELEPEMMSKLFKLKGKFGYMVFKEDTVQPSEIPKEDTKDFNVKGKSPQERLKSVLYRVWELNTNQTVKFNAWYADLIESLITKYKEKLPKDESYEP